MNLNPAPIMQLTTAYWASQAFLTANRIGLFEQLAEGPADAADLAARLGTAERPTRLLLGALSSLGLVEHGADGYANSPLSAAFLVPGRPGYLGNAVRYGDDLYATWGQLEKALRDDAPPLPSADYLGGDPERTRHFVRGMHDRAFAIGRALTGMIDLVGRTRLLDVGGGPGTLSALLVQATPGLTAQVLDLPPVVAIAREIVAELDAADRVDFLPGDYTTTAFPAGRDVVLISGVFHRETEEHCRDLIRRAVEALEPGGLLLVADVFADAGGLGPEFATLFGINMMLTAPDGGVHADTDVATWFGEAGLEGVEVQSFPPPLPHRLVVGRRPDSTVI